MTPLRLHALLVLGLLAAGCSRPSAPQATPEYDQTTGRLKTLTFDANGNGRNDSVTYMDGAVALRTELDTDENGKVDRWDFYSADHSVDRVGFSRLNDGVMDAQAFYAPDGTLLRMELSSARDGRFDRVEYYENGLLTRSTEDTNGDNRPDKWDTFRVVSRGAGEEPQYAVATTAFDDAASGHPTRRFTYAADGSIAAVEIDPGGTGSFHPDPSSRVGAPAGR
jgi:hypothetical protein